MLFWGVTTVMLICNEYMLTR